jgi:hypothetical protein
LHRPKAVMGRLARQCEMHALTAHCSERVCLREKTSTLPIADDLKRECFSQLALSLSLLMSFACAHSRIVSSSQPVVRETSLSVAQEFVSCVIQCASLLLQRAFHAPWAHVDQCINNLQKLRAPLV